MKNLTCKARTSIGEIIKKVNGAGISGTIKKKEDSTQFVYLHGIVKYRQVNMRGSPATLKIDTKEVVDVSFVGK